VRRHTSHASGPFASNTTRTSFAPNSSRTPHDASNSNSNNNSNRYDSTGLKTAAHSAANSSDSQRAPEDGSDTSTNNGATSDASGARTGGPLFGSGQTFWDQAMDEWEESFQKRKWLRPPSTLRCTRINPQVIYPFGVPRRDTHAEPSAQRSHGDLDDARR